MRVALLLALLCSSLCHGGSALATEPECMGSDSESWHSIDLKVDMRPGSCLRRIELKAGPFTNVYELVGPVTQFPQKTICSWSWLPGSGGGLAPAGDAPMQIVCTLRH